MEKDTQPQEYPPTVQEAISEFLINALTPIANRLSDVLGFPEVGNGTRSDQDNQ